MESILVYGDSNTWGLIPGTTPFRRYPKYIRWTGVLQSKLKNTKILEEGLCGRTTIFEDQYRIGRNGAEVLPSILRSKYPIDAAIIMLGTNDCKKFYQASANDIGEGIEQCLEELETYIAKEKILLISPIYLGEEVWKEEKDPEFDKDSVIKCRELKGIYESIAKKRGIHYMAASNYVEADKADDEHLNENGHQILANVVYDKLMDMKIL